MYKREYNPVPRSLFWLAAGFFFSACGAREPYGQSVAVESSEMVAPAVEMITHTPRPTEMNVANVDTESGDQTYKVVLANT